MPGLRSQPSSRRPPPPPAEGARLVWAYDGNAKAAGRIVVTGTLALPASLTLDVSGSGFLYSNQALFSAGEFAGATDLSGWTITGMPYRSSVARVGNELILRVNRGMILKLR
jgi:hypothetical protein